MTDPIVITITDGITPTIAEKLGQITAEALAADEAIVTLQASLNTLNFSGLTTVAAAATDLTAALNLATESGLTLAGNMQELGVASELAVDAVVNLGASAELTTATLVDLDAQGVTAMNEIAAAGARAAEGIDAVTVSSDRARASFAPFIGLLAGFFAATEVIHAVDNFTRLTNAITVAGLRGQQAADEFNFLTRTAEQNGVAISNVAVLYQRLGVAQGAAGLSTAQLNDLVTELTQSFRVQALDAAHMTNTMRDFIDIVESGGSTFTRFFQNLQRADFALVAAAAKGLGISITELDEKIKSHELTNVQFLQGLLKGKDYLQALADATNLTVSGALNNLQTAFTVLVYNVNNGTGAIGLIARGIQWLADNLPIVATAVLIFGAAWTAVKLFEIGAGFVQLTQAVIAFTIAYAPAVLEILASAAPILLVTGAVVGLAVAIAAATGHLSDLGDAIKGVAASAAAALGLDRIPDAISKLTGISGDAFDNLVAMQKQLASGSEHFEQTAGSAKHATDAVTNFSGGLNNLSNSLGATHAATLRADQALQHYVVNTLSGSTARVDETSNGIYRLTTSVDDLAVANDNLAEATTSWGEATTSVITTADGIQHTLITYKENLDNITTSLNSVTTAAAATSQALANVPKFSSDLSAAGPDIVSLPTQTSFPDITTLPRPKFATGGSFMVGGQQGTDRTPVSFWASRGERVDVLTPDQQRQSGGNSTVNNVSLNIYTPDANSFRKSRAQIARDLGNILAAGHSNG